MMKTVLIAVSFLPLLIQSSYLWQAWTGSRLDHWDWIFYLASVPAAGWACYKQKFGKFDFYALLMLVPALTLALRPSLHHINALAVASGVGVIFSTVWLVGSWQLAYRILPAALLLLLGTPSSSYQLSLLLMCPVYLAWTVKFLLAAGCFGWIGVAKRTGHVIRRGPLFFSVAALLTGLFLLHSGEIHFEGEHFLPEFPAHCGEFWGRSLLPDENTKRFFATSTVRQYRYTKNNADISVLAVKCGKNIHEIHPASHCLRTSMWTIHSEKILHLSDRFAVTEIEAQKGSRRILVWVWYSSEKLSTPGFLGFRRHFDPAGNYHTYQISLPITGDVEASRNELKNFVQSLRSE